MATIKWAPSAPDIAQVRTITVADTWANGDDVTITTPSGNELVITIGDDVTTANVATAIADAINALVALPGTGDTDATSNVGGQQINELTEVTASANGSVVTITANTAGKPFSFTSVATTAGDGDITETDIVAASGKNWYSVAENWAGGTAPGNGDGVLFEDGAIDCLYGLPTASQLVLIDVRKSFTGKIGLPSVNADNSNAPYPEYRNRWLAIDRVAGSAPTIIVGRGEGQGSSRVNIKVVDTSTTNGGATVTVFGTGRPATQSANERSLNLVLQHASNVLNALDGSIMVHPVSASAGTASRIDTLVVGPTADVFCAKDVNLANATITMNEGQSGQGGKLSMEAYTGSSTVLNAYAGDVTVREGTGTIATANLRGGTLFANSAATITTAIVAGGKLDLSHGAGTFTVTNLDFFKGFDVYDPAGRMAVTNGPDLYQCGIEDGKLVWGAHYRLTKGSVS